MDIFAVCICVICVALLNSVIKKSNREYALLITFAAIIAVFIFLLQEIAPLFEEIESITNHDVFDKFYLSSLMRAAGITILAQICISMCKDAGESALAYTVTMASRFAVLLIAFPIITDIVALIENILTSV